MIERFFIWAFFNAKSADFKKSLFDKRLYLGYLDKFSEEYAEDQICSKAFRDRLFAFLSEHSVSLYKPKWR